MSYIKSTLIFWAGLDVYPLILQIKGRNTTVFKTVHAWLPTAESFPEKFSQLCWETQNIFIGKLTGSAPALPVSNTLITVVFRSY